METKYEYGRTTYTYHNSYVRNTKAVGVLWGVFSICFAIINILVFIQPFWLGNTKLSPKAGIFGLYRYCTNAQDDTQAGVTQWSCRGQFDTFDTILSPYFKASTILVGVSALVILLSIACMLLFFFLSSKTVYWICSSMQFISFCCMAAGCVVFAASWEESMVKEVCGYTAGRWNKGSCELRWAYILAIIGVFDILFLSLLGFFLATKQVKLLPKLPPRGESNLAFNGIYTRGPVISPMDAERMSTLPYGNRAKAEYASAQNFQL